MIDRTWTCCLALVLGCYQPTSSFAPCTVTCEDNAACPADLTCVGGLCRNATTGCDSPVDAVTFGSWTAMEVAELSSVDASDPSLSDDLLVLYFHGGSSTFDVFKATRGTRTSPWGTPIPVGEINTTDRETAPEVIGNELYFSTNRETQTLARDIFRSTRNGPSDPWMAPARVDELSTNDESDVGIQPGGLRAVVGWRNTQPEQADLVEFTRDSVSATWRRARTLTELTDPDDDDLNGAYSSDGLTLYFSSNRTGDHDLYVATRPSLGQPFGPPQPIAELNMSGVTDADPWISPDGTTLYFVRGERLWQATRMPQ